MDKVERLNLGLVRKMSFLSLLEKECTQYFEKEYLSMKELMNKQGIVNDVLNEIGKYLNIVDGLNHAYGMETPIYEIFHTHYMFVPFSVKEYLKAASRYINRMDDIPYLLLPGTKKIIIHKKNNNTTRKGHQIYAYNNFIITYSYRYNYSLHTNYMLSSIFEDYNVFDFDMDKQYAGLLILLDKCVTLDEKDAFDFTDFIVRLNITNIKQIFEIISYFDNENLSGHLTYVSKILKHNN